MRLSFKGGTSAQQRATEPGRQHRQPAIPRAHRSGTGDLGRESCNRFGCLCVLLQPGTRALPDRPRETTSCSQCNLARCSGASGGEPERQDWPDIEPDIVLCAAVVSRTLALRVLHRERSIMQVHALAQDAAR